MGMVGQYASVTHNGKTKLIHRLRAEHALGKPLPKGVIVHHADGSRSINAPLVICQDQRYHKFLHIRMDVLRAGGNPHTDRICWKCKQVKPMTSFYRTRVKAQTSEGIMKECKQCNNVTRKANKMKARRNAGIGRAVRRK